MGKVKAKMVLSNIKSYEKIVSGTRRNPPTLHIPHGIDMRIVANMPDNEVLVMERFIDPRDLEQLIRIFGYERAVKLLNCIPSKRV